MIKILFVLIALFTGIHSFSFAAERPAAAKPAPGFSASAKTAETKKPVPAKEDKAVRTDAWGIIIGTPDFSTFAFLAQRAGEEKMFQGKEPMTVFVPNNDAFASLPSGTLEALLREESRKDLIQLVRHHTVPGLYNFEQVPDEPKAVTARSGKIVNLHKSALGIVVNRSNVVKADIETGNGFVHVVDRVLLPE